MLPVLFHIGRFPVPTYGLIAVVTFLACLALVRRYAAVEGRDPGATMDAIALTIVVGFVGARVFEVVINWDHFVASPRDFLFSTGVYMGGLITAIVFAVVWFRRIGLPFLLGLDLLGLAAALAMGLGRWGCFASGCCWGTPTDLPWAVTFPPLAHRLHPELPDVPLHPTQIYLSLNSLAILGVLVLAYRRKRFHGQIMMIYLMLYGSTRFFLEFVRGDAARGFLLGGLLSTSQFLSLLVVGLAAAVLAVLARRHRDSGEPDWQPASRRAAPPASKRTGRRGRGRRGKAARARG